MTFEPLTGQVFAHKHPSGDIIDIPNIYVNINGDTMTGNLTISNTAPSLILTDTTASAKSLTIAVDANIVDLRESAGASGSLLVLDLANGYVGIGTTNPIYKIDVNDSGRFINRVITGQWSDVRLGTINSSGLGSYTNFGDNSGGGLIVASNLYRNDSQQLKISATHSTMSGAAIVIPGNVEDKQNYIEFWTTAPASVTADDSYSASNLRMVIDTSGNVGIGTTAPRATLDVNGSIIQSWGDGAYIGMQYLDGFAYRMGIQPKATLRVLDMQALSADGSYLTFTTGTIGAPSEKMRITTAGNVGIGTTEPAQKLEISGLVRSSNAYAGMELVPPTGTGYRFILNNDNTLIFQSSTDKFVANATTVMTLNSGNVGIGTTNPGYKLDVNGNINVGGNNLYFGSGPSITTGGASILNLNASTYTYIPAGSFYVQSGSVLRGGISNDGATYLTISGGTSGYTYFSGNVGIGTTEPGSQLTLGGYGNIEMVTGNGSGFLTHLYTAGNIADNLSTGANFKRTSDTTGTIGQSALGTAEINLLTTGTGGVVGEIRLSTGAVNTVSTAKMTILNGGNVGIGTTTPRTILDIGTGYLSGTGLQLPHIVNKVASANVRNTHNAEATSTSATYVKVKTITLTNGLVGQQRFLFDIKTSDILVTTYGKIYRNGVALGTEQTSVLLTYATKSEDITQTWNPGDTCELWVHSDGAATVSIQNFQIAYDDAPTTAVLSANS